MEDAPGLRFTPEVGRTTEKYLKLVNDPSLDIIRGRLFMKSRIILVIVVLCATSSAGAPLAILQQRQKAPPSVTTSSKFSKMTDQFIKEWLALSPVNASQAGYHSHRDSVTGKTRELDAELDALSPAAYERQRKFFVFWQRRLRQTSPASLDAQSAADWRLVDDQISLSLLELETIQTHRFNPTV